MRPTIPYIKLNTTTVSSPLGEELVDPWLCEEPTIEVPVDEMLTFLSDEDQPTAERPVPPEALLALQELEGEIRRRSTPPFGLAIKIDKKQ